MLRKAALAVLLATTATVAQSPSSAPSELLAQKRIFAANQENAIAPIRRAYVTGLESLLKSLQSAGNLDGAVAVEQELKAVKATGRTTSTGSNVPELTVLRTRHDAEIKAALVPLQVRHIAALKELQDKYTKRGALKEALTVRQELSLLPSTPAPPQPGSTLPSSAPPTDGLTAKPADAVEHQGRRYKVFDSVMSWHEAQAKCAEMGGRLAIVRNAADSAFLISLAHKGKREGYWLGATDEKNEGEWLWVDGTPMKYSNWGPYQPNNGNKSEHYAILLANYSHARLENKWSDQPKISTTHNPGFICEWW